MTPNQAIFSVALIEKALGVSAQGPAASGFQRIHTDSRTIAPGDLFVALGGDNFDGNLFLADAVKKGAAGLLCRNGVMLPPGTEKIAVFQVDDTLAGFRRMAQAWREKFSIPVIAVAGSVGKTTTKELLASLMAGRWKAILKTEGSENGFVGIAKTLVRLRAGIEAAVIEIGIDDVDAMAQHLEVVQPTGAIVTAVAEEHLEKLGDLATIAREESLPLFWTTTHKGFAVVNGDDPGFKEALNSLKAPWVCSLERGSESGQSVRGELSPTGELVVRGARYLVPLPGRHNARNLLGAVTAGLALGLSSDEMARGLRTFSPAPGRSQILDLAEGVKVLADHYNASPVSTEAALLLLGEMADKRRVPGSTWVFLADMLELGPDELKYHAGLSDAVVASGCQGVFLFWHPDEGTRGRSEAKRVWAGGHPLRNDGVAPCHRRPAGEGGRYFAHHRLAQHEDGARLGRSPEAISSRCSALGASKKVDSIS